MLWNEGPGGDVPAADKLIPQRPWQYKGIIKVAANRRIFASPEPVDDSGPDANPSSHIHLSPHH